MLEIMLEDGSVGGKFMNEKRSLQSIIVLVVLQVFYVAGYGMPVIPNNPNAGLMLSNNSSPSLPMNVSTSAVLVPPAIPHVPEVAGVSATATLQQQLQVSPPVQSNAEPQKTLAVEMGVPENVNEIQPSQPYTETVPTQIPEELKPVDGQGTDEEKNIYLNFDNADLTSFVNYIAEIRKLNLIPDKSLDAAKISLSVRDPLTPSGAWNVFLTVLEMAGFSIVKVGEVYKVIPKDQKAQQPLPVFINIPPDQIPEDDSSCRYVMFLNNLTVSDYKDMVQGMLSSNGTAFDIKEVNGFIITDKCLNIRSAAKLLLELDQMGGAETATFIKLKNANAVDVKSLLEVLMKKPEVSPLARLLGKTAEGTRDYFPPGTRIIAEERLNALILIGDPKPIKKIEDFIVNYIDTELKEAKSPLHVYELQYTDASQIADILKEATASPESQAGQSASKYGAIRGGVKYFRSMNFKVDKDGNRLIVSSTDKVDWKMLKKTIQDLDKPQPQVAIETMIVTVDVSDEKELGGATRNKKHGQIGKNIDFQSAALTTPSLESKDSSSDPVSLLGNMISQITKQRGLAALTIGSASNIWSVVQALKTQTNTSILSQPFLTVTNKTIAKVKVGTEQRIVQETTGEGLTGYESVNADTELIITPQINLDGLIRLDIETNINEFLNTAGTEKVLRNLKTSVSVLDGQVLVLGGFVKTKTSETTYKTPILGEIPILGWFFKDQDRKIEKEYLFIFMCPTIMKPRENPGINIYTKMKLHDATNDIEDGIKTKRTPDPIYNWFFNPEKENYSHKVIDFANARYQPTTVDIKNDPYYRAHSKKMQESSEDEYFEDGKIVSDIEARSPVADAKDNIAKQGEVASNADASSFVLKKDQSEAVKQEQQSVVPNKPNIKEAIVSGDIPRPVTLSKKLVSNAPAEVREPLVQSGIVEGVPIEVSVKNNRVIQKSNSVPIPMNESIEDFKIPQDKVQPPSSGNINIDMKKRNRLKEFLSQNPVLSKNSDNKTDLARERYT